MSHIIVNANRSAGVINKNIYGHFSEHLGRCIYGGLANKDGSLRTDVVAALKELHVPVLRWPGGCFADTYHWQDGIGPKDQRKTIVNTNWGGVTEDNSFGTHEFMALCRELGCEPYISGNVGSGTVQEFSDWVEYCNMPGRSPMADLRRKNGQEAPFNVRYWGIGNETWGGGGNMRPEFYADVCRQYSSFIRSYDAACKPYKIACGASEDDYHWTRAVVESAWRTIDAISLHYYTIPGDNWGVKGSATDFDQNTFYHTLHRTLWMDELIENHSRIIRRFAKGKDIGLVVDEWGTWYDVEPGTNPGFLYQQNTMRDAMVAGITLNIFNNHCDTVVMANIAQMVNVLQAMVLTDGDKLLLTPTYHVFRMYRDHQDAAQLETYAETTLVGTAEEPVPDLHVSASRSADGTLLVTAANLSADEARPVDVLLSGLKAAGVKAEVLTGAPAAHNTFAAPDTVAPAPLDARLTDTGFAATLPPCSVAAFRAAVN